MSLFLMSSLLISSAFRSLTGSQKRFKSIWCLAVKAWRSRPGLRIGARIEKSAPRQKEEHPSGDKFGGGEAHVLTRTEWLFYSKNKTEKARALPLSEKNTLIHPLQRFQSGILY